jgi:hypothetical protein
MIQVNKLVYIGDGTSRDMNFTEQEEVLVTQHLSCSCNCRVKAEDCPAPKVYSNTDCSCECKNQADHEKCNEDPQKLWDPSTCRCVCREIRDCNSGYFFDLSSCQCKPIQSTGMKRPGRKLRSKRNRN